VIEVNDEQEKKHPSPMDLTENGIIIDDNDEHLEKHL
jgi:hypothetical protein